MKTSLLAFATILLAACSHESSTTHASGGTGGHGFGFGDLKPVTAEVECHDGFQPTSLQGRWKTEFVKAPFTFDWSYDFEPGMVTLTNNCILGGDQLATYVQVPYADMAGQVTFTQDAQHQEQSEDGHMTCSIGVARGTISYHFEGSCLVFEKDGEKLYLTHEI